MFVVSWLLTILKLNLINIRKNSFFQLNTFLHMIPIPQKIATKRETLFNSFFLLILLYMRNIKIYLVKNIVIIDLLVLRWTFFNAVATIWFPYLAKPPNINRNLYRAFYFLLLLRNMHLTKYYRTFRNIRQCAYKCILDKINVLVVWKLVKYVLNILILKANFI